MRSIWKGNFIKNKKFLDNSSTLLNVYLKKTFAVYNGKEKKLMVIERNMIGRKLGEFVFSRKMGTIHKKKVKIKKSSKK